MKDPKIKTKIVHSKSKMAWNVIGDIPHKYKVARVPYIKGNDEEGTYAMREEALRHAQFISFCFNNSASILSKKEVSS